MKELCLCAALAALMVCGSASAQTISGKYIVTIHAVCQPTITFNYDTNGVVNGVILGRADTVNNMFLATFSLTKQTMSFNGTEEVGDVLMLKSVGGGNGNFGSPFQETTLSGKMTYSNTASTLTLNGQTGQAFFGQIDKNGVAHYFAWQSDYNNNAGVPCSQQGMASRQ